jgi:hypothetical protein
MMNLFLCIIFVYHICFLIGGDFACYTRHEPVGICGQIIPVSLKQLSQKLYIKKCKML